MGEVSALKRGMERRKLRRKRSRSETLCFIALWIFCLRTAVSATQGDDFLDEKEGQLVQVVDAVKFNDDIVQKCALLTTCGGMNCSRSTCAPQAGDVHNYTCQPVPYNKYCNASAPGCHHRNYDYTRSFVRISANTALTRDPTTMRTCAQRALDPVFQNISKSNNLQRIFFGSIDGTSRTFLGSDQSANDPECGNRVEYDSRLRPWYRFSTSVPKDVAILIDAGQSMGTPLSAGQGQGTILDAVKVIVREFLKTLSVQDYVNIIMFDSTKVTPLSLLMVQVQPYQNLSDTTYLPELDLLRQSLDKQTTENQPETSDVAKGIGAALSNFVVLSNPEAAKVLLILTDGKFLAASNIFIPVKNLSSSNVKVFTYKVPRSSDDSIFLNPNSSFAKQLCSIGGSFEVIASDLSNPLLALNSFFTFTATLHAAVTKNSADYSIIFPSFEQSMGNISTMSRSVFSVNKTLLGVIGIQIHIEYLGNLTDLVQCAILTRSLGKKFKPAEFVLTNGGCSQIQTELPSASPCGPGVSIPPNGGFCLRTDQTSIIEDLACCQMCGLTEDQGKHGLKTGIIILIAVVVAIAVVASCFGIWVCFRKCSKEPWIPPPFPDD